MAWQNVGFQLPDPRRGRNRLFPKGWLMIVGGLLLFMVVYSIYTFVVSEPEETNCTEAFDQAYEWEQRVKAQLDYPETYDAGGLFESSGDGSASWGKLTGSTKERPLVGYNFETSNAFGVPIGMRTVATFTPYPGCELLDVSVFEGKFQ